MTEFIQQVFNGLSLGSIYALIALGYTMIYGILRFINFAHGDVFMIGAFSGYYLGILFSFATAGGGTSLGSGFPYTDWSNGYYRSAGFYYRKTCI